jgi:hypothetical protein
MAGADTTPTPVASTEQNRRREILMGFMLPFLLFRAKKAKPNHVYRPRESAPLPLARLPCCLLQRPRNPRGLSRSRPSKFTYKRSSSVDPPRSLFVMSRDDYRFIRKVKPFMHTNKSGRKYIRPLAISAS